MAEPSCAAAGSNAEPEKDSETVRQLILFDSEDGVDEKAWVALSAARSPAVAEKVLSEMISPEPGSAYLCEGKSWHRRKSGAEVGSDIEFWESCKQTDPGAVCFWEILSLDQEDKFPPSEIFREPRLS